MNISYYLKLGDLYVSSIEIGSYDTSITFTSVKQYALEFNIDDIDVKKKIVSLCLGVEMEKELK